MILLSIDPGTRCAGYGVMIREGKRTRLVDWGCWSMSGRKSLIQRVTDFHRFFKDKIEEHNITSLAIETPYLGKSVATYGKLSYLRGILYLLSGQYDLDLYEYSPRVVKQAVTGKGGASKEEVAALVVQFFKGIDKDGPLKDDTTDALAVGLCALWGGQPSTICRQLSL